MADCWICTKKIYAADPQVNINGKVHRSCCKCCDCGKQLTQTNAFAITKEGKKVLVCDAHNKARMLPGGLDGFKKLEDSTPEMSMISPAMARAAEAAKQQKSPPAPPAPAAAAAAADSDATPAEAAASPTKAAAPPVPPAAPTLSELVASLKESKGEARLGTFTDLVVMSGSGENKVTMASRELGLVDTLVTIVKEDEGEARMAATGVLWNLSVAAENRSLLCNSPGLLSTLVIVLNTDRSESRMRAFGVLHNLSLAPDNQETMAAAEFNLVPVLLGILHEDSTDSIDKACNVLWNLSVAEKNRPLMASVDIVSRLASLIIENESVRSKAFIVLYYLTLAPENRVLMGAAEGLLSSLSFMLLEDKADLRVKACGMLVNLSSANENKPLIAAPTTDILPLLVKAISGEPGDLRTKACSVLWNLSVSTANRSILTAPEVGLLPAIVDILNNDSSDSRVKACVVVQNLAGAEENQTCMAARELGLVSALAKVIIEDKGEAKPKALGAILNLCISSPVPDNQYIIATSPGLVSALTMVMRDDPGDPRSRACGVLQNLAVTETVREPILSEELNQLDLLAVTANLMKTDTEASAVNCLGLLLNLSVAIENKVSMAASFEVVDTLVYLIKECEGEIRNRSVNLVCSLLAHEANTQLLKDFNAGALVVVLHEVAKVMGDPVQPKAIMALGRLAPGLSL